MVQKETAIKHHRKMATLDKVSITSREKPAPKYGMKILKMTL
jgi:hypothetical protein